jgi:hypothetical protein
MAADAAAPDSAAPESSSNADHFEQTIRRVYQAWLQGDCSSEDALFAISDALGAPDKSADGDRG